MKEEYIKLMNSKIIVKVSDLDNYDHELNLISKRFGVWNKVYFKYDVFSIQINEEKNLIKFPKGIGLYEVQNIFPNITNIIDCINDKPYTIQNTSFKMRFEPRNEIQKDVLDFLHERKAYSKFKNNLKLIGLDTGEGKTFVTLQYLSEIEHCALVIVDQINIIQNWLNEISKLTTLREKDICVIKNSKYIESLMNGTGHRFSVFIVCHKTLQSYSNENSLHEMFKKLKIGCKVYDEAHVEFRNIINIELNSNIPKTIFLTATPNRSNFSENILYAKVFKYTNKYFRDQEKNAAELYHKIMYVKLNSSPSELDISGCNDSRYGFNIGRFFKYITFKKSIYDYYYLSVKKLLNICYSSKNSPKTIGLIFGSLEIIDMIYQSLKIDFPDKQIDILSSKINKKDKIKILDKNTKKDIIISTEKSFQKSLNILTLECIINYVPLRSDIVIRQLIGRLRKNDGNSIYIDITDHGFPSCVNQLSVRKRALNKKAKKTYQLEIKK